MNCHTCGTPLKHIVTDLPFKLEQIEGRISRQPPPGDISIDKAGHPKYSFTLTVEPRG
jgi:hypothetical protein